MSTVEELWGVAEVARYLGKHRNWVYAKAKAKELPSLLVGRSVRFDPEDIRAWLKKPQGG